jgi:hypothetical protein
VSASAVPSGGGRSAGPEHGSVENPSLVDQIAAAIPGEVLSLRPEDIRVEDALMRASMDTATGVDDAASLFATVVEPETEIGPRVPRSANRSPGHPSSPSLLVPEPETAVISAATLLPPEDGGAPREEPPPSPLPPPIEVEADEELLSTAPLPSDWSPGRRRTDITLPASVVLFWSVFVLAAQALAFIAGLLIGHFYWKVH